MPANETINPQANLQFALSTEHSASKMCACAMIHEISPQNQGVTFLKSSSLINFYVIWSEKSASNYFGRWFVVPVARVVVGNFIVGLELNQNQFVGDDCSCKFKKRIYISHELLNPQSDSVVFTCLPRSALVSWWERRTFCPTVRQHHNSPRRWSV